MQVDVFTPTNTHGLELLPARRVLNLVSLSTPEHEAMQAIIEQAKQNEQRPSEAVAPPDSTRRDRRCKYREDHDRDSSCAMKDLQELVRDVQPQHHAQTCATRPIVLRRESPPLAVIHMIYSLPTPSAVHTIQTHPASQKQLTPVKRPHEAPSITFDNSDRIGITVPHIDPLVIELCVNRFTIERVLIDQGSTSEVMYYKTFIKLGLNESNLSPAPYPLFSFNANPEYPLGKIILPVRAGS
ncbi:uncharacterized protein LOC114268587 [Camellia sinensis]|uniref:uncharacterized protein LOC114268587 n=1 Tax=Camellia sinensis TaxID=4442 RepID=UPI001036C49E|nr:uncharacterized protein LOC114268587 [Camellia sinensis]